MKKNPKFVLLVLDLFVDFFSLFKPNLISVLESYFARKQGKGWGRSSTDIEVRFVRDLFQSSQSKSPIIFDVGANVGQYLRSVLIYFPNSPVYAFEPSQQCKLILTKTFGRYDNIHIINEALGIEKANKLIYFDDEVSPLTSFSRQYILDQKPKTIFHSKVIVSTLDTFCRTHGVWPEIIKIDVEGYELEVLLGGKRAIQRARIIQFEFGSANVYTRTYFKDFHDFFTARDFKLFRISKNRLVPIDSYSADCEYFDTTNYLALRVS